MTAILIQAVQFFASLSLLVLIHEFGHFITARMFGMRVDKFYLFFNPGFSLWKRKIGSVEYGIGWLPLGGYVSIYDNREPLYAKEEELNKSLSDEKKKLKKAKRANGENSAEVVAIEENIKNLKAEIEKIKEQCRTLEPDKDELRGKPAWQRLIVMVAGVVMNVILAIVIYSGMLFHSGENYYHNDDMIYGYVYNDDAEKLGFVDGDRILTIDNEPVDNIAHIAKRLFIVDHDVEVKVARGDEQITLTLPLEDMVAIRQRGGHKDFHLPNGPFIVGDIKNEEAKKAGLKVKDRIIAINNVATPDYASALPIIKECADTTSLINITVERAKSENIDLEVPITKEGIGISVATSIEKRHTDYTFWSSIPAGVKRAGKEISDYWDQITMMVKPETQLYQEMGGFIAIGSIFPDAWNWAHFWSVTALLSIILAVMNLLPIPVLDGGHVLFTLWEIITRRKPNERVLIVLQNIGFWLLMALIIYANGSDILRLFK